MRVTMTAVLCLLTGCGGNEKQADVPPEQADMAEPLAFNEAEAEQAGSDDVWSTRAAALPRHFPNDVPIPPNARITHALRDGETCAVNFETTTSVARVTDFYQAALKTGGWILRPLRHKPNACALSATKQDRNLDMAISASQSTTKVEVAVSVQQEAWDDIEL